MEAAAQNDLASRFRELHNPKNPLLLLNVYDAATAKIVASNPETKAIATASFAVAATEGVEDDDMTLEQNLRGVRKVASVALPAKLPLTVDLQDGYDDIEKSIKAIIAEGAVGCNIEDVDCKARKIRTKEDAVQRIKDAKRAADDAGVPQFAINGRTDALKYGGSIDEAIERGKAFLAAGASNVYVLFGLNGGTLSTEEITNLSEAFDGRLNVKFSLKPGSISVQDMRTLPVARISAGPELYRVAMSAYEQEVKKLIGKGD